jgi:anti-sigma regulatory factor (Ser/Thr protein kinase)
MEWGLPADLTAAQVARAHVRDAAATLGLDPDRVADLVLVASELAANAVRHGAAPMSLLLDQRPDRIRVTVVNHGEGPDPRVLTAHPDAGHGRGLAMVESLADAVGWSREGDRLEVWAEFAISR